MWRERPDERGSGHDRIIISVPATAIALPVSLHDDEDIREWVSDASQPVLVRKRYLARVRRSERCIRRAHGGGYLTFKPVQYSRPYLSMHGGTPFGDTCASYREQTRDWNGWANRSMGRLGG